MDSIQSVLRCESFSGFRRPTFRSPSFPDFDAILGQMIHSKLVEVSFRADINRLAVDEAHGSGENRVERQLQADLSFSTSRTSTNFCYRAELDSFVERCVELKAACWDGIGFHFDG